MDFVHAFNESSIFAKLSLLVGFGPPGLAIGYLVRPAEWTLAMMRPVSLAAIFAAISGWIAGLMAISMGVAATSPKSVNVSGVYAGLADALLPPFVNFGLLAVAWLLVAIGMVRRPRGIDMAN